MKKILYIIIFLVLFFPNMVFAEQKEMNIYLFYGDGCPHCAAEEKFLEGYLENKDYIKLHNGMIKKMLLSIKKCMKY